MILCAWAECDQGSVSAVAEPAPGPEREITQPRPSESQSGKYQNTCELRARERNVSHRHREHICPSETLLRTKRLLRTPYFSSRESLGDTNLKNNAHDELFVETFLSIEKNGKYEPDFVKMR